MTYRKKTGEKRDFGWCLACSHLDLTFRQVDENESMYGYFPNFHKKGYSLQGVVVLRVVLILSSSYNKKFSSDMKAKLPWSERSQEENDKAFEKHYAPWREPFACPSLSCRHSTPFLPLISCSAALTWLSQTITSQRLLRVPFKEEEDKKNKIKGCDGRLWTRS